MNKIFIIVLITISNVLYCQIPIGKNIKSGKTEFISFMKKNGFNLIKEQKTEAMKYNKETDKADIHTGNFYYTLLFREEVEVKIYFNKYSNIDEMYIFPEKEKNIEKILEILKFNEWQYVYERTGMFGTDKVYKFKDFYAMIPNNEISQINFYNFKP